MTEPIITKEVFRLLPNSGILNELISYKTARMCTFVMHDEHDITYIVRQGYDQKDKSQVGNCEECFVLIPTQTIIKQG